MAEGLQVRVVYAVVPTSGEYGIPLEQIGNVDVIAVTRADAERVRAAWEDRNGSRCPPCRRRLDEELAL